MQVTRHPGGHGPVLAQLDQDELADHGAVDRVEQKQPARPQDPGGIRDDGVDVRHVLEHVNAVDDVRAGIVRGQVLTRPDPVVDGQPGAGRVLARGRDRARCGINPDD